MTQEEKKVTLVRRRPNRYKAMAQLADLTAPHKLLETLNQHKIDTHYIVGKIKEIIENGGKTGQIDAIKMIVAMMVECRMAATGEGLIGNPAAPGGKVDAIIDQMKPQEDYLDEQAVDDAEEGGKAPAHDGNTFGDDGRFDG